MTGSIAGSRPANSILEPSTTTKGRLFANVPLRLPQVTPSHGRCRGNITIPQWLLRPTLCLRNVPNMRVGTFYRLFNWLVGALLALTISISAVAANGMALTVDATVAATLATHDGDCQPASTMPGCDGAALCELMCLTSALTLLPEPLNFFRFESPGEPPFWADDWPLGIASPLDLTPPRTIHIG